jgi:superoxide dismutase, Cu-Zn family
MHAGDLPNIEVKNDGTAKVDIRDKNVTLEKGKTNSLFKEGGTSIIIHEKDDDYMTNPAGNAGNRIAGGMIVEVK